jgi:hypothetical protein
MTTPSSSTTAAAAVRSEEGLTTDDADGALILSVDGVEVRESNWAGAYYCAHVLYLTSRYARSHATSVVRDTAGDPLFGFIHVPADAETGGSLGAPRSRHERHARTGRIIACALAGVVDELRALKIDEPRVLLTGFGPFAAVISNPTGDFVDHGDSVAGAFSAATGAAAVDARDDADGVARMTSGGVTLGRLLLDVHDDALDQERPRSLPWTLHAFAPHAVLGLGVHRASSIYRVELEPTNAGLALVDGKHRHDRGRPIDARDAYNRALVRAIANGAARLRI